MARDYGWLSLAVVMAILGVANVVACVGAAVVGGDVLGLVRVPVPVLFSYWMGVGAWRRTRWGLVTVDAADVPVLDATHTRRLVVLGAACCIAFTFALALQVVVGRA